MDADRQKAMAKQSAAGAGLAARRAIGQGAAMRRRLAAICCLTVLGLPLAGRTKCGWIWQDWTRACHADAPPG